MALQAGGEALAPGQQVVLARVQPATVRALEPDELGAGDLPDGTAVGSALAGAVNRLRDTEEALDIGITSYLDSGAYCLIEWPELIEPLLPGDCVRIKMEIVDDSTRKILFL